MSDELTIQDRKNMKADLLHARLMFQRLNEAATIAATANPHSKPNSRAGSRATTPAYIGAPPTTVSRSIGQAVGNANVLIGEDKHR